MAAVSVTAKHSKNFPTFTQSLLLVVRQRLSDYGYSVSRTGRGICRIEAEGYSFTLTAVAKPNGRWTLAGDSASGTVEFTSTEVKIRGESENLLLSIFSGSIEDSLREELHRAISRTGPYNYTSW